MEMFGEHFVAYVARRLDDHDALLSVLGRHLRDFLNGLDNLHERLPCACFFLSVVVDYLPVLHSLFLFFFIIVVVVVIVFNIVSQYCLSFSLNIILSSRLLTIFTITCVSPIPACVRLRSSASQRRPTDFCRTNFSMHR